MNRIMLTRIARPSAVERCENREPFTTKTGWYIEPFVDEDGNEYEKATHPVSGGRIKTQWFVVSSGEY